MNTVRLANVIFDKGQKITQSHYETICESIADDRFTLDDYVLEYKLKEQFVGKVPYLLQDGSKILVSESLIRKLNTLSINKEEMQSFMNKDYSSFKKLVGVVNNGSK
jgi:hypothetical protein